MKLLEIVKNNFNKIVELELSSKDFIRPQAVKEAFHVSYPIALKILDLAEKFGHIRKRFNILSPVDETVIAHCYSKEQIPEIVYDEEHDCDRNFAFIKTEHEENFVEVVYEYTTPK